MDVIKYIESGILEAYLSGKLSLGEMKEVENNLLKYPQIKVRLNELIQNRPRDLALENIMGEITEEERENFVRVMEEQDDIRIKRINVVPRWSIVAFLLLLISLMFNLFFYGQIKKSKERVREVLRQNETLVSANEAVEKNLQVIKAKWDFLTDGSYVHIKMKGLALAPESFAEVFWNKENHQVYISPDNLPAPPKGQQYQLWAIKPGQAPLDAGVFKYSTQLQALKSVEGNVESFAVTLEKEGGNSVASVQKTYVKGEVKAY